MNLESQPLQSDESLRAGVLVACQRRLRSPDVSTRKQAVETLSAVGRAGERLLRRALVDTHTQVRMAAVASLSEVGALGDQEALLELLKSDYSDVREYAVQALGELGDARALSALMGVYARCFTGRSARRQRLWVLLPVIYYAFLIGLAVWEWGSGHLKIQDLAFSLLLFLTNRSTWRSSGEDWQVILKAILQVAERNPSPEVHQLLPDLKAIAADRMLNHPDAREAARAAAERIETLTAGVHDLPLPAVAPSAACATLPVPMANAPSGAAPAAREVESVRV